MSKKDAYVKKVQAQLNQWDSQIEDLKAKASEAGADAQIEYERQVNIILENQKQVQLKLDDLRRTGTDAWIDMQSGVEKAWIELKSATQKATSNFTA